MSTHSICFHQRNKKKFMWIPHLICSCESMIKVSLGNKECIQKYEKSSLGFTGTLHMTAIEVPGLHIEG